jgi:hypothetical protein
MKKMGCGTMEQLMIHAIAGIVDGNGAAVGGLI